MWLEIWLTKESIKVIRILWSNSLFQQMKYSCAGRSRTSGYGLWAHNVTLTLPRDVIWWARKDLNLRPLDYESTASDLLSYDPKLIAVSTGFEPVWLNSVTGRHPRQADPETNKIIVYWISLYEFPKTYSFNNSFGNLISFVNNWIIGNNDLIE